jgi:inhibitor of KinA
VQRPFVCCAYLTHRINSSAYLHPAYCSLLIDFNPLVDEPYSFLEKINGIANSAAELPISFMRTIEVPVRYGGNFGPDLNFVATQAKLSVDDFVRRHFEPLYKVAFLGFAPGFPYLAGLDSALYCERLATPRLKVPAGSIAIGGLQTGIYPEDSPGGWRVIGRTDLKLFNPLRDPPSLFLPGDQVRFVPISSHL